MRTKTSALIPPPFLHNSSQFDWHASAQIVTNCAEGAYSMPSMRRSSRLAPAPVRSPSTASMRTRTPASRCS